MQFYGFFPQLIDQNSENFHVMTLNGRRLSFKNPLKSVHLTLNGIAFDWKNWYFSPKVALLISSKKSLENLSICNVLVKALFQRNCLKSVHFMKI